MVEANTIFFILVLLTSVIIHEISHGYVALKHGDETAKNAGRLTLNPLKHIDPIGSVLIPLFLILTNAGFIFGWAKPVPINPYNFRDQRKGMLAVASAGVLANLGIALIFSLILRLLIAFNFVLNPNLIIFLKIIVVLNIILAIFNLLPIPPLDGSKILFTILHNRLINLQMFLEKYSLFILLFFILFLWKYLIFVVQFIFFIFTGQRWL